MGNEREANSSSPSMNSDDPEIRVGVDRGEGADGVQMRRDARLVIRGAAAVEAVAAQGRLERQRVPVGVGAGRLHVVVGVEEHGGATGASRTVRDDSRLAELGAAGDRQLGDVDGLEDVQCAGQLRHPLGAGAHVGVVESVPGHRGDADQTGQLGDRGRESRRHRLAELVGVRGRIGGRCHVGYLKQSTTARTPRGQDPESGNQPTADAGGDSAQEQAAQGKSAPTPTRREQEAARKRPLVPTDRKQASRDSRGQVNAARDRARAGMAAGEEKYLPVRDKGPQKRYVRDYVDARTSVGEILLPLLVIVVATYFLPSIAGIALIVVWIVIVVVIVDCVILGFQVRKRLAAKFGAGKVERGVRWYATMRAIQIRPLRLPKTQTKRGQYPS